MTYHFSSVILALLVPASLMAAQDEGGALADKENNLIRQLTIELHQDGGPSDALIAKIWQYVDEVAPQAPSQINKPE